MTPIILTSWILLLFIQEVMVLPAALLPPSSTLVTFYVYPGLEAREEPQTEGADSLLDGGPLTIVFHGFKGDHTAKSMESIKEALLVNGVKNVVVVDWGPLADSHNKSALSAYHHVRDHGVHTAAGVISEWLQFVMGMKNIQPDQVHLIGFSLGAHLAAIIGQSFNSTIGRITGLDPPKFGYEVVAEEHRLDASDAMFVNIIHTSPGVLSYKEPIGHVDFFPNGDVIPQNGCPYQSPIHIITCSHYFSFSVFVETIFNKNAFVATECDSWESFTKGQCANRSKAPMGYHTTNTTRGVFYSQTSNKVPFGEEDPKNPIPKSMFKLLIYDEKNDSIVNASDVVNFLMHKEPTEPVEIDNSLSAEARVEVDTRVMRVKNARPTSTTEGPPAFLSSAHSQVLGHKYPASYFICSQSILLLTSYYFYI